MEDGLEANAGGIVSTGQNHCKKVANKYFKNVTKFKYLETKATNQNSNDE
jgi:hypothetical protein